MLIELEDCAKGWVLWSHHPHLMEACRLSDDTAKKHRMLYRWKGDLLTGGGLPHQLEWGLRPRVCRDRTMWENVEIYNQMFDVEQSLNLTISATISCECVIFVDCLVYSCILEECPFIYPPKVLAPKKHVSKMKCLHRWYHQIFCLFCLPDFGGSTSRHLLGLWWSWTINLCPRLQVSWTSHCPIWWVYQLVQAVSLPAICWVWWSQWTGMGA